MSQCQQGQATLICNGGERQQVSQDCSSCTWLRVRAGGGQDKSEEQQELKQASGVPTVHRQALC